MENHTFTHTPRAPHVTEAFEDQRYFTRHGHEAGLHVSVRRMMPDHLITIETSTYGPQEVAVSVRAKLTADECEALARALVDAAHDLRTHNSLTALHNAIAASEGAAS